MEIKVNFLDKLRLEAKFDDFTVVTEPNNFVEHFIDSSGIVQNKFPDHHQVHRRTNPSHQR